MRTWKMTADDETHLPAIERPGPPGPATADDETLRALEQMLANPDDRLCGNETTSSPTERGVLTRELLERLDTLGVAGQRDVMGRVISIFETDLDQQVARLSDGNRRAFCDQLERLRHEAERPWPDAVSFCRRAENLITMLEAPAPRPES